MEKKLAETEYKVEYENHMVTRDYIIVESVYEGITFKQDAMTMQEARHIKANKIKDGAKSVRIISHIKDGAESVRVIRHYDGNSVEIF